MEKALRIAEKEIGERAFGGESGESGQNEIVLLQRAAEYRSTAFIWSVLTQRRCPSAARTSTRHRYMSEHFSVIAVPRVSLYYVFDFGVYSVYLRWDSLHSLAAPRSSSRSRGPPVGCVRASGATAAGCACVPRSPLHTRREKAANVQ